MDINIHTSEHWLIELKNDSSNRVEKSMVLKANDPDEAVRKSMQRGMSLAPLLDPIESDGVTRYPLASLEGEYLEVREIVGYTVESHLNTMPKVIRLQPR